MSFFYYANPANAFARAATICKMMVVGGRQWTDEQKIAGEALLEAAKNIEAEAKVFQAGPRPNLYWTLWAAFQAVVVNPEMAHNYRVHTLVPFLRDLTDDEFIDLSTYVLQVCEKMNVSDDTWVRHTFDSITETLLNSATHRSVEAAQSGKKDIRKKLEDILVDFSPNRKLAYVGEGP